MKRLSLLTLFTLLILITLLASCGSPPPDTHIPYSRGPSGPPQIGTPPGPPPNN